MEARGAYSADEELDGFVCGGEAERGGDGAGPCGGQVGGCSGRAEVLVRWLARDGGRLMVVRRHAQFCKHAVEGCAGPAGDGVCEPWRLGGHCCGLWRGRSWRRVGV